MAGSGPGIQTYLLQFEFLELERSRRSRFRVLVLFNWLIRFIAPREISRVLEARTAGLELGLNQISTTIKCQTLSVPFFSRTTTHDGKHGGHIRQIPQCSHYILCGYWICFPWKQGHWLYPAAAQPFRSKWEERTLPQHPQSFHNMTLMIENSSAHMDQKEPGQ